MAQLTVPFYFGLGSRYSYLASTQLARIEQETGCKFEWLPLQSGELIRRANNGKTPFHNGGNSGQYDWTYRQRDAEMWADFYGVPYKEPKDFRVDPADLALACWAAASFGKLEDMARVIFQAIFVDNLVITRETLSELAESIGLNGADMIESIDLDVIKARHETALVCALDDGAFGVPTFVVNGKTIWGNDRLPLVWQELRKLETKNQTR